MRAEEGTANLRTKFLRFISEDTNGPDLNDLSDMHIEAGKQFITQGQDGDAAYDIHRDINSSNIIIQRNDHAKPPRSQRTMELKKTLASLRLCVRPEFIAHLH